MALTLNETDVALNATFNPMLKDLQGNILKHHGRTHAFHLFFVIKAGKKNVARQWLKKFATERVTSSFKQLDDSEKFRAAKEAGEDFDGGFFYTLSLANSGYEKLGVPLAKIPTSVAFRKSMRNRKSGTRNLLEDKPTEWETGFKKKIDGLIIVADAQISRLTAEKDVIITGLNKFSDVVVIQKGKVLRNGHGVGIEHFGYADGVSQPNYLDKPTPFTTNQWDDNHAVLKDVLVADKGGGNANSFGSYFVFRKLEQNVAAFKEAEEKMSKKFNSQQGIKQANGTPNDELAGAMLVGRFEDGTEVVNSSKEDQINSEADPNNDFDYRSDTVASKCPFHAHIRITNPRADVPVDFAKSVRLTRRGIPFNDIGRDEFNLEDDQPTGGVGLLFMCYNSRLEDQFEFIQSSWANKGDIGGHLVGQDPIIGQGPNTTDRKLPDQWGTTNGLKSVKEFKGFVTMKGGEYFFTPSISFLKSL